MTTLLEIVRWYLEQGFLAVAFGVGLIAYRDGFAELRDDFRDEGFWRDLLIGVVAWPYFGWTMVRDWLR